MAMNQESGSGKGPQAIAGINITPFTDICLVLLIIFMVTAKMFDNEQAIRTSMPMQGPKPVKPPKVVICYLHYDPDLHATTFQVDNYYAKFRPLNYKDNNKDLLDMLSTAKINKDTSNLVLKGDNDVPCQDIVTAIDLGRQAHLTDVSLADMKPGEADDY